jgi:hypothetical protein
MASIQVNVLRENRVFKYAIDPNAPSNTVFSHKVHLKDQITWRYWQSDQRVEVAFEKESSPFAAANGTSWSNERATFPDHPAVVHPNFDKSRLGKRIKYTVTLLDEPGQPKDDPEVIVVDGGD